jgi:predicted ABC-type ATPase
MNDLQDIPTPSLIMVRGLPGSGKSYLAVALQESIGKDKAIILDPDAIDQSSKEYIDLCKTLTAEGIEGKFFPNRFLKQKGYEAISEHKIIIWNQAFTLLEGFNRSVKSLQDFAAEHDIELPTLVVEVEISENTAKQRVAKREQQGGHGVTEEAFARFINDYVSFVDKGYNTVTVHGENDISVSIPAVMGALKELAKK